MFKKHNIKSLILPFILSILSIITIAIVYYVGIKYDYIMDEASLKVFRVGLLTLYSVVMFLIVYNNYKNNLVKKIVYSSISFSVTVISLYSFLTYFCEYITLNYTLFVEQIEIVLIFTILTFVKKVLQYVFIVAITAIFATAIIRLFRGKQKKITIIPLTFTKELKRIIKTRFNYKNLATGFLYKAIP